MACSYFKISHGLLLSIQFERQIEGFGHSENVVDVQDSAAEQPEMAAESPNASCSSGGPLLSSLGFGPLPNFSTILFPVGGQKPSSVVPHKTHAVPCFDPREEI